MSSELSPLQISDIKQQLREGKQPHEISRKKNPDGTITRLYPNEAVREIRSLMRKEVKM